MDLNKMQAMLNNKVTLNDYRVLEKNVESKPTMQAITDLENMFKGYIKVGPYMEWATKLEQ